MIDGFYSIFFTGMIDSGFGILILKDGVITGVDAAGATYDGQFTIADNNRLSGELTLVAPAGVQLVTGAVAGEQGQSWTIPLDLPTDFADGQTHFITTPTGKVNVIFRKIRD